MQAESTNHPVGRVTQTAFPSSLIETYSYDAANNLTSKTDRKNQTIQYVYDALNRLTQKTYPDSTSVEYTYDLVGKVLQVNDPTGTYGFSYDNMGRLIGTSTQYSFLTGTFTNSYSYDGASNRTGYTAPDGSTNTYSYDNLNRLTTLANSWAGSFGFSYDALSRRTQMTRPNGVATNYTYDNLSRLLSVLHQLSGSTIDGAVYTVDAAGNRTSKADQLAGVTSNYSYDAIYELTQVTQGATTTESYSYDPVGNRTASLGVSSYTTNSSNEMTANSNASYTYDNNGNLTSKTDSTGTTSYTWDFENRLASVTLPGSGGVATFKYDPFGKRIQKVLTQNSTTTTTNYVYDGADTIEETDQNGNVLAKYARTTTIDEPLAESRSGAPSYYEADGLGSVTSLTSGTGAFAQTYTFDSFGKLTGSSGSTTNPFRYTSREFGTETGLYFYRARYYDPVVGRFVSEDPIRFRGGNDFYSYVWNRSINRTDPRGLKPCKSCQECPGGTWSGAGVNFGGILVMGGVFTGIYRVDCWSGKTSCLVMTTCSGTGLGLGGSVTGESIWIFGACSSGDLAGTTDGLVAGGGVGVAAAGGSGGTPPTNHNDPWYPSDPSNSSGYTYGAGLGLGGGYVAGKCNTTVLGCTHH